MSEWLVSYLYPSRMCRSLLARDGLRGVRGDQQLHNTVIYKLHNGRCWGSIGLGLYYELWNWQCQDL